MEYGLTHLLLIALGGGLGSMARAGLSGLINRHGHSAWGTFVVNLSGGFLIGLGYGAFQGQLAAPASAPLAWEVLAIGLLGGYTTVSSFALQTLELARAGAVRAAAANALGSVLLCPLAAAFGVGLMALAGG